MTTYLICVISSYTAPPYHINAASSRALLGAIDDDEDEHPDEEDDESIQATAKLIRQQQTFKLSQKIV